MSILDFSQQLAKLYYLLEANVGISARVLVALEF